MEKPSGVPDDAHWSANDNEWVQGNEKGTGTVRYWRPDGSLCCVTEFKDGVPCSFERFHETGEVSRKGVFDEQGRLAGVDSAFRAKGPTTELTFPADRVAETVVRCDTHWQDGNVLCTLLYDAKGNRVLGDGRPSPALPPGVPETAICFAGGFKHGAMNQAGEKVGTWAFYDEAGQLVEEVEYDPPDRSKTRLVPAADPDNPQVAYHVGPYRVTATRDGRPSRGRWMGDISLLDADRQPIGTFDPTGGDAVENPKARALVERVRAVAWKDLTAKGRSAAGTDRLLVTLIAKPHGADLESLFDTLWDDLNHQGDVYDSSVAAIPHLIDMARLEDDEDWQERFLALVASMCEVPRQVYEAYKDEDETLAGMAQSLSEKHEALCQLLASDVFPVQLATIRILACSYANEAASKALRSFTPADEIQRAAVLTALGALGTLEAARARDALAGDELLVQLAALMGMALKGDKELADAATGVLVEALTQDEAFEEELMLLPRVDDDLVSEVVQLFSFYGADEQRSFVIDKVLEMLDGIRGLGAVPVVNALLSFVYGMEEDEEDDVDQGDGSARLDEQRLVLQYLVDKDDLWLTGKGEELRIVNLCEVLREFGLPDTREELRKLGN